jgi:CRP-like cAMP-binding protein
MFADESLMKSSPVESDGLGTVLLQRGLKADTVVYLESGRVRLGLLGTPDTDADAGPMPAMAHLLGVVEGPSWLEATSAVLSLVGAVDAVAETDVTLRRVPLAHFRTALEACSPGVRTMLLDMARAHRQQTDLAVSRLAKDAEARCAEWLLRHAQSTEKGGCAVQLQQRKRLIAAQLGIAPETLSRVLRHLRERSLISGSGRVVNLVDLIGLRSLAGV